jgi:hypothetical protein
MNMTKAKASLYVFDFHGLMDEVIRVLSKGSLYLNVLDRKVLYKDLTDDEYVIATKLIRKVLVEMIFSVLVETYRSIPADYTRLYEKVMELAFTPVAYDTIDDEDLTLRLRSGYDKVAAYVTVDMESVLTSIKEVVVTHLPSNPYTMLEFDVKESSIWITVGKDLRVWLYESAYGIDSRWQGEYIPPTTLPDDYLVSIKCKSKVSK